MECLLLAQAEFPWVTVITVLGGGFITLLGTLVGGAFLHLRELKKIRLENAAEREKVANDLAKAKLLSQVEEGKHINEANKQCDEHDQAILDRFLQRIDKLENKMDEERARCVEEIKEVRAQHMDCMKLHAEGMRKIGQLEAVQRRQQEDSVNVCRDVAEIKATVAAVAPAPQPIGITLNVSPEHKEAGPPSA